MTKMGENDKISNDLRKNDHESDLHFCIYIFHIIIDQLVFHRSP